MLGTPTVSAHEDYEDIRSAVQITAAQVQALATPNLVAAYSFNENTGIVANDNSGNTNTATLNNGANWTAGKNGSGVNLDGVDDFLSIADSNSLDIAGPGTISAWVKLGSLNRWHGVFAKGNINDGGTTYNYGIEINNLNRVVCFIGNGSAVNIATSAAALSANLLTYLSCTWDGTNLRLYIGGNLNTTVAQTITPAANTTALLLGQYGGNVDRLLGVMDEVRIYNRALTQTEIQSDMNTPIEPDSVPPTVSLTSPIGGDIVSGTISVSADASDNIVVTGVQFLLDGANLGAEDTAVPYSVSWDTSTASNAAHTLTAQARDGSGNVTISAPVTVAVNNPPKLIITAPANSQNISGSTVNVAYTTQGDLVSYEVNHVHFVLDAGPELMDLSMDGVYQLTNVSAGSHTLNGFLVRADHTKIFGSDALPINFTTTVPDTTLPSVAVTSPLAGSTVAGTVNVAATATDNVAVLGVQFLLDGANLGTEDLSSPYSVSWNTLPVTNGTHALSARARDAAGNTATATSVAVTVFNSNLVAAYSFNEGTGTVANDLSGKGNTGNLTNGPTWSAAGKYGGALTFDGVNDLVNIADANSLDLTNGMTLEAWVNSSNLTGWKTIVVKDQSTNNFVYSLSANNNTSGTANQRPVSRIMIASTTRTVTGTTKLALNVWTHVAATYDGANLRLFVNGVQVSSTATTGSMTANTNLLHIGGSPALGAQYFTGLIDDLRIYNRALVQSEIQSDMNTALQPDTIPPTVSITAPADGATVSGTTTAVAATSSDNVSVVGVQFLLDGANLGAEDTASPYSVNWNTTTASNTSHALTARARDAAGNSTTSVAVIVTVNNPPKLVITQPANNASINGSTLNITYNIAGDTTGYDVNHVHFKVDGGAEIMDLPPIDGVFQINNIPAGAHTLDGFLVRVDHSKINGTDAQTVNFTMVAPDTQAPTVSITAPLEGSNVSSVVTVAATASDNVGVVGVQFMVDGNNLGSEDTTSPYSISWNTSLFPTGAHALTAKARDASLNSTTSAPVNVTVTNANDPSVIGQWTASFSLPLVALHLAQLTTGKILMWEGQTNGGISARVWDPISGSLVSVPNNFINLFCAGHVQLATGEIMTVGGHSGNPGVKFTSIFNPITQTWTRKSDMNFARWYPTGTTLPDGRVLVTSGSDGGCFSTLCVVEQMEVYDTVTNAWTVLPSSADYPMPLYPHNFVLSDGRFINVGGNDATVDTRVFNLTTNIWSIVDPQPLDAGSAVMYGPNKFMKVGHAVNNINPTAVENAHGRTYVLDMNQPNPTWRETASMNFPRVFHVTTLLPDGTTLVTGGGRTSNQLDNSVGVLEAEIWSPITETWSIKARAAIPRLYHGSAILLPDARVLIAGSGANTGTNQYNGEIYSPPYLFKGPRPTISSAPATAQHNSQFFVGTPDGSNISRVTMIRSGTMTHSFNPDQRFLELTFQQTPGGLLVNAPANANIAPPGYYMLFLNSNIGVPSQAAFVRFPSTREDLAPPTAPSNLVANGSIGTASLTWNASSDNIAVTNYNIHRATTAGFVPSPANRIAQPTGTSFQDNSLSAGTYYYRVTAQDANANVSPSSNEASAVVTADTQPPTVTMTAPAPAATVSGTVTVSADAADDVAVAGVQFLLDGSNLGTEDLTAPYSISWSTMSTTNGTHTLSARARDTGGNLTTATPISITVSNTGPAGLVAAYSFNANTGTTAVDSSGNNNTGTLVNGAGWTAGKYGSAISLDGINDHVTIADSNSLDVSTGTLSMWVKPAVNNVWHGVISKSPANDDGRSHNYGIEIESGNIVHCVIGNGSSVNSARSTSAILVNQFTHIACSWDGTSFKLYLNGVLNKTVAQTLTPSATTSTLYVGAYGISGPGTDYMQGALDELQLYNRALTAAEIVSSMNNPLP